MHARAHELGSQAVWLGLALGCLLGVATLALAGAGRRRCSGATATSPALAARYLRISAAGVPAVLLATAGQGYLRGVSSLRRPLEIVIAANVANLVLELRARVRARGSASTAPRSARSSPSSAWAPRSWRRSGRCRVRARV